MIPVALIGRLPTALSVIERYAGISAFLRLNLGKIPNPIAFTAWLYKELPGTPRVSAWDMYRAAKFFRDQRLYLGLFGPEDVIDPKLAGRATVRPGDYNRLYPFRYRVVIDLRDPATGEGMQWNFWVQAGSGDSVSDVKGMAIRDLIDRLRKKYGLVIPLELSDSWVSHTSIVQFDILQSRASNVSVPA